MKLPANDIVLKLLGLLLLAAAVLKSHELLTAPMANADIWTNRYFMIFQVEFELALGIWLLSGLFKRVAWLAALGCFVLFCGVTLYKALSGFGSCGCFGNVHINPWITLFAIDLPAVILLSIFRQKLEIQRFFHISHWLEPRPRLSVLAVVFLIGLSAVAVSSPVLILNEPPTVTTEYEVLKLDKWIGKKLPVLEHINIAEQLKTGNWLVVLYNYDCSSCADALPKIEQIAKDLKGNEDFLRVALIEIPPYAQSDRLVNQDCSFAIGKLDKSKQWLVSTPSILATQNSTVLQSFQEEVPFLEKLVNLYAM